MNKTAHLIIAHPNPRSLNYALKNIIEKILRESGYSVHLSDIYEMEKQGHSAVKPYGSLQSEKDKELIKQEQQKIKQSLLTIIQFPLYWFTFPGLLKNYFETVWELGFAFGPGKFKESPLYDGRKVLFSITTQSKETDYSDSGLNGDISRTLFPMETAFKFVGFQILPAFVGYGVMNKSVEELQKLKNDLEKHIKQSCKQC